VEDSFEDECRYAGARAPLKTQLSLSELTKATDNLRDL
jgi:hypothetical protein